MINKTAVVMECTVEGVDSDGILERLPQHEADTMCRIIINGINRLFKDERARADYEQWKKSRTLQGGIQ